MSTLPQIHVAVVDDDESSRSSLSRLLRTNGMQTVTYTSAETFLADTNRPRFQCLLLDIQLGGMSGIELHRQLNASGSTTPVIYITAHGDRATRQEAQAAGCAGYFLKTDSGEDVLFAIYRAIGMESPDGNQI